MLDDIFNKKYTRKYSHSGESYETLAIDEQARNMIEDIIRNHVSDDREEKLGILEAKVFTYERIIANSNFAPLLNNPEPLKKKAQKTPDQTSTGGE